MVNNTYMVRKGHKEFSGNIFIFFFSHPGLSNSGVALVIPHPGEVDVVDAFKYVDDVKLRSVQT